MPRKTDHAPKVSTRSVYPYARESSREKRQQGREADRQTHTHADELSTFLDVLWVVHPKSGLISNSIFCTMPTLPWDTEVIGIL